MAKRPQKSFIGTMPVNTVLRPARVDPAAGGRRPANVVARHTRLAEATRRAVKVWAGNNGPQLYLHQPGTLFRLGDRHPDAGRP